MRELLFSVTKKDLTINYFSGTGAGGQHRNKHQNCVRMSHRDSGAMATGQRHRERQANLRDAFKSLVESFKFKAWCSAKTTEIKLGQTIEEAVADEMDPGNLKIEIRGDDGKWIEEIK